MIQTLGKWSLLQLLRAMSQHKAKENNQKIPSCGRPYLIHCLKHNREQDEFYVLRGTQKLCCEGLHSLRECSLSICTMSGPDSQGFGNKAESLYPCNMSDSKRGNGGRREAIGSCCSRKASSPSADIVNHLRGEVSHCSPGRTSHRPSQLEIQPSREDKPLAFGSPP